jgi:Bacterial EndoU nuclease
VVLDRLGDDGGADGNGSARELRLERAGGDGSLRPIESAPPVQRAETRTRAECYEVARAASGRTPDRTDAETDRGGWSGVDATDRPPAEEIRVTPDRATHILDGDGTGGGHRHGAGKPGKTEFPASWNDEKIVGAIVDVARRPDQMPVHQEWNDRWVARGRRDDVGIVAVLAQDGRIWTSWPTPDSPGVIKNPEEP